MCFGESALHSLNLLSLANLINNNNSKILINLILVLWVLWDTSTVRNAAWVKGAMNRNFSYLSCPFFTTLLYVVIGKLISVCNTKEMFAGAEPVLAGNFFWSWGSLHSMKRASASLDWLCLLLFYSALKWIVKGKCKLTMSGFVRCGIWDCSIWSNHSSTFLVLKEYLLNKNAPSLIVFHAEELAKSLFLWTFSMF